MGSNPSTPKGRGRNGRKVPRVVILGGGYGGIYTALRLQRSARRGRLEVYLVSRENFFLFQPMLAEVVSGSIEPTHILNPIRRLAPSVAFYQAEIEAVDLSSRQVVIRHADRASYRYIRYDYLVVAVGTGTDLSMVPGLAEHSFPFKTMGDALSLRDHLIRVLERAEVEDDPALRRDLLTFVVAGGGFTGVEVAAETNEFVREAARSYPHVDAGDIEVILLNSRDRILPELPEGLASFSHRILEGEGIEVRLGTRVAGATAESVTLTEGRTIRTRTIVSAIGTAPNRLLDKMACRRDARGRIVVDETLAVAGLPGVWAVGDCAAVPDLRKGGECPPTAQYAVKEARHVAREVLSAVKGAAPRAFSYRSLGVFLPLGRYSAAAQVMGLKVSGLLAWWLYRTYYLYQLPRLERRVKVVLDWTLQLLFRRDIVQIDISQSDRLGRGHYETGQTIFRQGELARNFYIIVSGQVEVYHEATTGETPVATLGPGEYFGEMALLRGGRHTASVRASTAVDLLIMSGSDFTALATSSTRFGELLSSVMRQRAQANAAAGVAGQGGQEADGLDASEGSAER